MKAFFKKIWNKNSSEEVEDYTVLITGAPFVGKSTLTLAVSKKEGESVTVRPAGDSYARMHFFSLLGDQMTGQIINEADGFILLFSVSDRRSFVCIPRYIELIHDLRKAPEAPILVVGNKTDLDTPRQVLAWEATEVSRRFLIPYYEISALKSYNVEQVISELGELITCFKRRHELKLKRERQARANESASQIEYDNSHEENDSEIELRQGHETVAEGRCKPKEPRKRKKCFLFW